MNYNLLDENWIPVLWGDGRTTRVGIKQALTEAGHIRQIAASNPMDRVALIRLLLAILYWCRGNPPGQEELHKIIEKGQFPADWFSKLDEQRDCFNLLGDGKRFYQNEIYKQKTPEHTTHYLIHEVPSGTNQWHFRHSTDLMDGLCPACCAMGLIRLPVFSTSGGKGMSASTGKSPGINAKPPLYVLPVAKSLATTLLLSWRTTDVELGKPGWDMTDNVLPQEGRVSLLNGLTWVPRSIWLGDPEASPSICVSCGRHENLIRRCVFDGKGSSKAKERTWRDPHVIYEAGKDGKVLSMQTQNALGPSDTGAGSWAKHMAGILRNQQSNAGSLWVVGFSTVQNDKYLEATEHMISRSCSPHQNSGLTAMLERWHHESARFGRSIRPDGEPPSRKHGEIKPTLDSVRPHVETRVSAEVNRQVVGEGGTVWDNLAGEYTPMMEVIAKSLSPGNTAKALKYRNQITQAIPDISERPTSKSRESKEKKGGKP